MLQPEKRLQYCLSLAANTRGLEMGTQRSSGGRPRVTLPAVIATDWYTVEQACEALSLSRSTLNRMLADRVLGETRTYAGRRLISKAGVQTFIQAVGR